MLFTIRFAFAVGALDVGATWTATLPSSSTAFSVVGWVGCGLMWLGSLIFLARGYW